MSENLELKEKIQRIKDSLTVDDIITLVTEGLGSDGYKWDPEGNPIFQTVCHNDAGVGKYKLYYYIDGQYFHCYTECGSIGDIFHLVQQSLEFETFGEAWRYVLDFFGYEDFSFSSKGRRGFHEPEEPIGDWDIINKFISFQQEQEKLQQQGLSVQILKPSVLEFFGHPVAPKEWLKEDMTHEGLRKFGIRVDSATKKIIIPHRNINGDIIGVRGRSFNEFDLEQGRKYMPAYIGDECLNHPLGENLFGIYENKEAITRLKKAVIFEGEKSVIRADTYYGKDNFCVASCGSSLTRSQINLLLNLGIEELILAYDKECDGDRKSEDTKKYEEKLLRLVQPVAPYVNVYIVFDYDDLLSYKESPIDQGQRVLETLMKKKIFIPSVNGQNTKTNRRRK